MLGWLKRKREQDPKKALEVALGGHALPSFPRVAHRVLAMLRDPNAEPSAIADALAEDPGLTVKVLGLANSSAFAVRHPVRNVAHSISLLGRSSLESLLISLVVRRALPNPKVDGFDPKRFWRAAARRATSARALADTLHPATRSECFTASLLSDMAVPLIAHAHGERYGEVLQQWHADGGDLASLERSALGFDHASTAGWVAQKWAFPDSIADAIGGHHDAEPALALASVSLVAPLRESDDDGLDEVIETVRQRFGVQPDVVAGLLEASRADADDIASRMA